MNRRVIVLSSVLVACGSAESDTGWTARVDTIGDTIAVHTMVGARLGTLRLEERARIGKLEGEDYEILGAIEGLAEDASGHLWLYDVQVPALRTYAPDGRFIATIGRKGGGPGEYESDGGVAVLRDGRIVLRDPGNGRFNVYNTDGSLDTTWPHRGGLFTSTPLVLDTTGSVWTMVVRTPGVGETAWPGAIWITELVRIAPDGTAHDTIGIPRYDFEPKVISARRGNASSINNVPFTGRFEWAQHPFGGMVTAVTDRYAVDWHRPDGTVLRMSRDAEPVPVSAEEKANAEELSIWSMRRLEPSWRWNGPPIPDFKPPLNDVLIGRNGRIWVQVAALGERIPDDELEAEGTGPMDRPAVRFREPVVFDVFEPDGRYVGRVHTPRGFKVEPHPVFEADRVWAVVEDELGVQYVVRFAIVPETTAP